MAARLYSPRSRQSRYTGAFLIRMPDPAQFVESQGHYFCALIAKVPWHVPVIYSQVTTAISGKRRYVEETGRAPKHLCRRGALMLPGTAPGYFGSG